jgi:hypothetical protein
MMMKSEMHLRVMEATPGEQGLGLKEVRGISCSIHFLNLKN